MTTTSPVAPTRPPAGGRPLRVLHLTGETIGGSAEHVLLLARSLDPARFEVSVGYAPGGPLDDELEASPTITALPLQHDHAGAVARNLRALPSITDLLRTRRFDILHTHTSVAGTIGRLAARRAGVPVAIHMLHAFASHDHIDPVRRHVFRRIERRLDPLTTHYVAGSEAIKWSGYRRGIYAPDKCTTIPYAVDIEDQLQRGSAALDLRGELGIGADTFVIGFVGRLEAQKGLQDLVSAYARVRREATRKVALVLVGDGTERAAIEEQATALGVDDGVCLLGWRTDVPALMGQFDCMALSSRWEAFGIVNLESMLAGTPVVAYGTEGIPEVVAHGRTGLLCAPGDLVAFTDNLARLVADPVLVDRLGRAGPGHVRERYGHRRMVEAHEHLYERLVRLHAGRP